MAIHPLSRYTQGNLLRVTDSGGTYNLTVFRSVPAAAFSFTLYQWNAGDRWDLVAERFYGDPSLWWAIVDANPEVIDPTRTPPGTLLRIPAAPIMGQGTLLQ